MSSTFITRCDHCDEEGPRLHRSRSGEAVGIWPTMGSDIFDERLASEQWSRWLIDHEYCEFKIIRE